MGNQKIIYLVLIASFFFFSCSKDLYFDASIPPETETVNNFVVRWPSYVSEEKRQVIRDVLNSMILVEGDIFMMGNSIEYDPDSRLNESPAHYVQLSDYYICAKELSYEQVQTLLSNGSTRSSSINNYNGKYLYYSWDDWKSILDLLYEYTNVLFTFPTEAQWEFAARGGKLSLGFKYPGSNDLDKIWTSELDEINHSLPNEIGLYNMADLKGEWCADTYAEYESGTMLTNPLVTKGEGHVVRGGCYASSGEYKQWVSSRSTTYYFDYSRTFEDSRMCRSTARACETGKNWDIGCRVAININ